MGNLLATQTHDLAQGQHPSKKQALSETMQGHKQIEQEDGATRTTHTSYITTLKLSKELKLKSSPSIKITFFFFSVKQTRANRIKCNLDYKTNCSLHQIIQ